MTNRAKLTSGSKDCPCIDASTILAPYQDCKTRPGFPGLHAKHRPTICFPLNFGSNFCRDHDNYVDPNCMSGSDDPVPEYCHSRWCYVDFEKCKRSKEIVGRSELVDGADLYYSYTTCNSSNEAWLEYATMEALKKHSMIKATIPKIKYPHHHKFTLNGTVAEPSGEEYYNNSIPFQGALIDYIERIVEFSDEIDEIKYQYRTGGSDILFPSSSFTASALDVQLGISDISIGAFWITAERLRMVTFTTTITIDKTVLVVPQPEFEDTIAYSIKKLLQPFETSLWWLLVFTIFVVGSLSIWFASPRASNKGPWIAFRNDTWRDASFLGKAYILYHQLIDAVLKMGVDFFQASVDFDYQATMPYKVLMFGFSFLILICVAAYTANLAAFLTQSGVADYVDSMDKAIAQNIKICAHPVVRTHLQSRWPDAHFVFNYQTRSYAGILESYDDGKCQAMAIGWMDTRYDTTLMEKFCERKLVYTDALVIEIPMAFPVKNELAAGISHWFYVAEKKLGLSFDNYFESYKPDLKNCTVEIQKLITVENGIPSLSIKDMAFPFLVLALCAIIAILKKLFDRRNTLKAVRMIAKMANMDKHSARVIVDMAKFAHLDIHDIEKYDTKYDPSDHSESAYSHTITENPTSYSKPLKKRPVWRMHNTMVDGPNQNEERRQIRASIAQALNPNLQESWGSLESSDDSLFKSTSKMNFGKSFYLAGKLGSPKPSLSSIPESTSNKERTLQSSKSSFGRSMYLANHLRTNSSTPHDNRSVMPESFSIPNSVASIRFTTEKMQNSLPSVAESPAMYMRSPPNNSQHQTTTPTPSPVSVWTEDQLQNMINNAVKVSVKDMIESAVDQSVSKKIMEKNT